MVCINMDIGSNIDAMITAIGGAAASILAWKQGQKNAKSTEIDNVVKVIGIWEETANKLKDQVKEVQNEMVTLKKNHEDCEESKKKLEELVKSLDGKVCELTEAMHNVIQTPKPKRKGYNSAKSAQ